MIYEKADIYYVAAVRTRLNKVVADLDLRPGQGPGSGQEGIGDG